MNVKKSFYFLIFSLLLCFSSYQLSAQQAVLNAKDLILIEGLKDIKSAQYFLTYYHQFGYLGYSSTSSQKVRHKFYKVSNLLEVEVDSLGQELKITYMMTQANDYTQFERLLTPLAFKLEKQEGQIQIWANEKFGTIQIEKISKEWHVQVINLHLPNK